MNNTKLILASSSQYRAKLLQRLRVPFEQVAANIDESQRPDEAPLALVERLSTQKAEVVANSTPDAWVIGSDQIALFNGTVIGKPGNHHKAVQQLQSFSGNLVEFITGVCLFHMKTSRRYYAHSTVSVYFKTLTDAQIESYLKADTPYDCAGSFKVESLGVCLFDKVVSEDPTSLEGLPLISLCKLFSQAGITLDSLS